MQAELVNQIKAGGPQSGAPRRPCQEHQCSPPPVDPNVGRSREPGVEDVDAADGVRTQQRFLERRVVVEP